MVELIELKYFLKNVQLSKEWQLFMVLVTNNLDEIMESWVSKHLKILSDFSHFNHLT